MQACESAYSSWKFSGGFRTWVKMSLVKTKEEDGREAVEFRQEVVAVFCYLGTLKFGMEGDFWVGTWDENFSSPCEGVSHWKQSPAVCLFSIAPSL